MNLIWVFEIPVPNPYVIQHAHPYEEYLIWIGTDPENIHDLHGEVEFGIGGETYTFDTTTAIYIPKNVPHCPMTYKRVDRPHAFVALQKVVHTVEKNYDFVNSFDRYNMAKLFSFLYHKGGR
jgi:hypothetical protein